MAAPLSFNVGSRETLDRIRACAVRAQSLAIEGQADHLQTVNDWIMDFCATHANGCPVDWSALLVADDFNFAHDAFGIYGHLDRRTGKLTGCFIPRFAVKTEARS